MKCEIRKKKRKRNPIIFILYCNNSKLKAIISMTLTIPAALFII